MSGVLQDTSSPVVERSMGRFSRRDFLAGGAAAGVGLVLDAGMIERHDLETISLKLKVAKLPEAFHGYRIAQLSDVHLDEFTEPYFLRLAIRRINQMAPDLVLLTGDFATFGRLPVRLAFRAIETCAEALKELNAPLRYGCLGNHDVGIGSKFVVDTMAASGTPVLVNQYLPIERQGQRLWLGAVDEPGTSNPIIDLAVPRRPDGPVILMCHPPDYADVVVRHPRGPLVDVMLSGHSHGGQVRLPFLGAMVLPPMGEKYVAGHFQFNQMQLYVNRGLGTVGLPFRLNCPPEVTLFTLEPA